MRQTVSEDLEKLIKIDSQFSVLVIFKTESLNVATATAIVLSEFKRRLV
jgi:tRNA G18 (ribose-2'-O)-methylase SpoU